MTSTYTANQGLEKPATGDRSGTWGTMTNTNMDMLDRAISGVGALTLTGTATTLTTSEGSASDGNYKVLVLGGSPSGTNTITLSPNDGDKLYFVVNGSGQSVIFSQGTGANVTVANGAADIIYADGAGSGAAVSSYLANDFVFKTGDGVILNLQTSDTTVTASSVLGRLNFTAPDEASGTDAILLAASIAAVSEGTFAADSNATKLSFMTGASEAAAEKMSLSSGGNLTVSGDVTVGDDIVLDSDSAIIYFGDNQDVLLTHVADSGLAMSVTGNNVAQLSVTQDKDDASTGPVFNLNRYSASPDDADGGGLIQFNMENSADELFNAAQIYAVAVDVTDGTEDGKLIINTMKAGTATAALTISELGTATFGGNIIIPDSGTIGSASDTDAIAIRSDGNVGIGAAASDTKQVYVYDNTTTDQIMSLHQDNALNAQQGLAITHDGTGIGLYCQKNAGTASAVYGYNNSASSGIATRGHSVNGFGGYFQTNAASSVGCAGFGPSATHYGYLGYSTIGVYGTSATFAGALSKGSGTFRISHPLKSEIENEPWDLCHSFIEGPQCDLIYRGRATLVDGQASLSIDNKYGMTPGTFEWLTKADDVQTFTSNETGWDAVKSSFSGDTITIECQNADSTDTISWMVVAERGDPNIKASEITDDDGNLIIERPSMPEPPPPPDFEPPPEV
jgi:hypothetical protein